MKKLEVLSDFHNKIVHSKEEYHNWINKNNKSLYLDKIIKSIACDVKIHPETYLIHSFYINSKNEGLVKNTFQIIPQRNNIVPKNIFLNTSRIAYYICNKYFKLFDYAKSEIVLHCKNIKNMYGVKLK